MPSSAGAPTQRGAPHSRAAARRQPVRPMAQRPPWQPRWRRSPCCRQRRCTVARSRARGAIAPTSRCARERLSSWSTRLRGRSDRPAPEDGLRMWFRRFRPERLATAFARGCCRPARWLDRMPAVLATAPAGAARTRASTQVPAFMLSFTGKVFISQC